LLASLRFLTFLLLLALLRNGLEQTHDCRKFLEQVTFFGLSSMNYIFFAAGESCPGRLGLSWFGIQEEEHTGQNDFICIPPFLAYCMLHTLLTK
jgi:hypothetical protein